MLAVIYVPTYITEHIQRKQNASIVECNFIVSLLYQKLLLLESKKLTFDIFHTFDLDISDLHCI